MHDTTVSSISYKFEGGLNVNKLQKWIGVLVQQYSVDLFRYKGVLAVKGMETKFVFQGVHMLFAGGFNRDVAPWGADETPECRFVFIGRNLDKMNLEAGFEACKAKENLRFKVGDTVYANVGGSYAKGKVLMQWNEGNPYRIELEKDGTNVWGPIDEDIYVRGTPA